MHFIRISRNLLVLALSVLMMTGCFFQRKVSKAQRKAYKQEEALQKASDEEYNHRIKAHYDKQSKETQKSMKKMKKNSRNLMKSRYRPWYRDRL